MRRRPFIVVLAAAVLAALAIAPVASALGPRGEALFIQAADSGTFHNGKLTLSGVSHQVAWFTDRPQRDSGTVSFKVFRRSLFSGKQAAPNAALDLAGKGLGGVAALRLTHPRFDAGAERVTYDVKRLKNVSGNLNHYVGRLSRRSLPSSFGAASLFVDNAFGNTCYTTVIDSTSAGMETVSSSKWSTDSWDPALPSSFGMGPGDSWSWGSQGGNFRGCSNSAVWQLYAGASGTVSFQTTDPWTGSNTLTCNVSNPAYRCVKVSSSGGSVTWSIGPTPP
jgi:hypothetical protein